MIMTHLDVPILMPLQEDAFSCVPRCVKMIFMYISNSLEGKHVPDFDLEKIEKIIETKSDGTFAECVVNLNGVREIKTAIPSIEFEMKQKWHSLDEITDELNDKQPPIAYIRKKSPQGEYAHAILITGVDVQNHCIHYIDPSLGEIVEDLSAFITQWDDEDRVLIKVKIGKKPQRMLDVYLKDEDKTIKE